MLKQIFSPKATINPPQPGLFHYRMGTGEERSRLHLRIDPGGQGTLIVNSSRILHLNPTAALMVSLVLEKVNEASAIKTIRNHYRVSREEALADLQEIRLQLDELIRPDGACPI